MEVLQNCIEKSGEVGVVELFCGQKMETLWKRGSLHEIPSVVGVWIFSGTTHHLLSSHVV